MALLLHSKCLDTRQLPAWLSGMSLMHGTAGMEEVPDWLLFDQQDVHDTLVATSKHKPHLIADMAAMANVPGLANGHARRPIVLQTQQYASQVGILPHPPHDLLITVASHIVHCGLGWGFKQLVSCSLHGLNCNMHLCLHHGL